MFVRASTNRGAVAVLTFRRGAVPLYQHRIVNVGTERAFDCLQIRLATVACLDMDHPSVGVQHALMHRLRKGRMREN